MTHLPAMPAKVSEFFAILAFGLATGMTPGPNNTLLMISGANWGLRATTPHLLGIIIGFPAMIFLTGLGLGRIFTAYPVLHIILRYVCFAWILFLAWKVYRSGRPEAGDTASAGPMGFWAAVLFQWVNPKAWVMAVGAMALFVPAVNPQAAGHETMFGILRVTLGFFLVSIPSSLTWCLFGAAISAFLNSEARIRAFNMVMAVLLVASVVPMLW